jgi:cardiolipin synthase A/B
VWTGRGATGGVRSTVPVILEMLAEATNSVLLLSYSVWLKQSRTNTVLNRLAELSSRGVDVAWIVDTGYRSGHNRIEIGECWPAGRRRPHLYGWRDVDDEIAKLHAKVLIVDDRDALVTSANLTGHGLTSNIELGLRVRGAPATELAAHLHHLIVTSAFHRLDWPA